jgi:hypothetical protein
MRGAQDAQKLRCLLEDYCYRRHKLIKRQATRHDCLSSWLGTYVKVYGDKKKYFVLGRLEQPRQDKNLFYRPHDKPNEPTKEGPLSYVLLVSPFASVSTFRRGHPSLVSLDCYILDEIRRNKEKKGSGTCRLKKKKCEREKLSLPDMRGLRKLSCGCWTTQCEYLHQHTINNFSHIDS